MAGSSESDDASDIFWPGYVDAISNLAINLLFVIAVMCIVILSFVLEETTKGKPQPGEAPVDVQALQAENVKLKQEMKVMQQAAQSSTSAAASSSSRSNVTTTAKLQEVQARQEVVKEDSGQSTIQSAGAGLVVNFDPKVVALSADEAKDVFTRLQSYGPPATSRWQITVITPKGFSESARLGYYRAVAVRNVLIQNGVPGEQVNMRVLESSQAGADSARVTVNQVP